MKKVLFAVMAIVLAFGLIGSAFAYFNDQVTSANNVFTAGNLSLKISNDNVNFWGNTDGNVVFATDAAVAPGVDNGPYTIWFRNAGNIAGEVSAVVSFTGSSTLAKALVVDQAYSSLMGNSSPTDNVAGYWAQQIIDAGYGLAVNAVVANTSSPTGYYPTVYGLSLVTLKFTNGYNGPNVPLTPYATTGAEQWDQMYVTLPTSNQNQNSLETQSINISVTATITSN